MTSTKKTKSSESAFHPAVTVAGYHAEVDGEEVFLVETTFSGKCTAMYPWAEATTPEVRGATIGVHRAMAAYAMQELASQMLDELEEELGINNDCR